MLASSLTPPKQHFQFPASQQKSPAQKEQNLKEKIGTHLNRKLNQDNAAWTFKERWSRQYSNFYFPFETTSLNPLPDFLLKQIDNADCKCFMGLFPEIQRVWMTINNRLFLWNYLDNSDFYSYEGMEDVIVTVSLVHPKKGIFEEEIQFLLVLCTEQQINLLGVSFGSRNELCLYKIPISCPTDDVIMLDCIGLDNGQLFFAARDGHLYEMEYEAEESWFKRKTSLKNLTRSSLSLFIPTFLTFQSNDPLIQVTFDEKRKLLYTLSDDSCLQVFALYKTTIDNEDFYTLQSLTKRNLPDECRRLLNRTNAGVSLDRDALKIISIQVTPYIENSQSADLLFVAVTQRGYRLYFGFPKTALIDSNAYAYFELLHVRALQSLEEDKDLKNLALPLTQFDVAYYSQGAFFAAGSSMASGNSLFFSALEMNQMMKRKIFSELASFTPTMDRIWSVTEDKYSNLFDSNLYLNDLVAQGVYTVVKRRPVDILIELLTQSQGHENESIKQFCEMFGEEQISVMFLAIACENKFINSFQKEGSLQPVIDVQLKTWATHFFYRFGFSGKITFDAKFSEDFDLARPLSFGEEHYSFAYHAIILYLSRLLKPIWNSSLKQIFALNQTGDILTIIENCVSLRSFCSQMVPQVTQWTPSEKMMVENFILFCDQLLQAMRFFSIVFQLDLEELLKRLPEQLKRFAESCSFSSLMTAEKGLELIRELTKLLMNDVINRQSSVDPLCDNLSSQCPQFFNIDDVKIFKATELLQNAPLQKQDPLKILNQALKLLLEASKSITKMQLKSFCDSLTVLGFPEGAIQLSLSCAQKSDPENVGLQVYLNKNTPLQQGQIELILHRMEFYKCTFEVIEQILDTTLAKDASLDALEKLFRHHPVFVEILKSKDELFHYMLFDRLAEKKQLVYYLKAAANENPFLEKYLEKHQYDKSEMGLYLCLLYRSKKKYTEAVSKLYELATLETFPANLEKRIELLSLAINLSESKSVRLDQLEELNDLNDVANVQWEIYKNIESFAPTDPLLLELDRKLLTVSELYPIAEQYDLNESKLSILFVSNHHDEVLLFDTWQRILFSEDMTQENRYLKLKYLGQKFLYNQTVLPLDFLIPKLEAITSQFPELPALWIVDALIEAGYSYKDLFLVYDGILHAKPDPFNDKNGQYYILKKIFLIINQWKQKAALDYNLLEEKLAQYKLFLASFQDQELMAMLPTLSF